MFNAAGNPEKGDSMKQETLEKGKSMKQEPLEKGSAASSSQGGMAKKKIMVDFQNTLSVNDYEIPQANHQALETLINLGYSITICSWCFKKREREVMETLRKQPWFPKLEDASEAISEGDPPHHEQKGETHLV